MEARILIQIHTYKPNAVCCYILLTIINILMIVDHTDGMKAPLCPHVDDWCPGPALSRVSPDFWPVSLNNAQ